MTKKNLIEIKKINKTKKQKFPLYLILIKLILFVFIAYGIYLLNSSYSNSIELLAVNEDSKGNPQSGSLVKLSLEIKPGTGQTYVNLNTLEEIDTQISIINSQKIACDIFNLNCNKYDFYYSFEGSALVLKGPSASSAIAILTAKTVNKKSVPEKIAITGSLNSGGFIGNVGGIDEKIAVAEQEGFTKVIVPLFSKFNETKPQIEVIKTMDIVEAYNNFDSNYKLENHPINNSEYKNLMGLLSTNLCSRTQALMSEINFSKIKANTSEEQLINAGEKNFNNSKLANLNQNFYSEGSFCFSANLNYRTYLETNKNETVKDINTKLILLKHDLDQKYLEITSEEYVKNILTINDFYVYLLVTDRLNEAEDLLSEALESLNSIEVLNTTTTDQNNSSLNNSNITTIKSVTQTLSTIQKQTTLAYASERFETVKLWEQFIVHSGSQIQFDESTIDDACFKITHDISLKRQVLQEYGINSFNSEISQILSQSKDPSKNYLCIYQGLELNGRINTILNSVAIDSNLQKNYTQQLLEFTQNRVSLNSNGDFPLIPTIYTEYAQDLFNQEQYTSSMLYANYALSYSGLNLYLEEKKSAQANLNIILNYIFENPLYFILIVLISIFIN